MLSQLFCCLSHWQPMLQELSTDKDPPTGNYTSQQEMSYKEKQDAPYAPTENPPHSRAYLSSQGFEERSVAFSIGFLRIFSVTSETVNGDARTQDSKPSGLHLTSNASFPTVVSCFRPYPPGLNEATFELQGGYTYTIRDMVQDADLDRAVIKWNDAYETSMQEQREKFGKCERDKFAGF
ncbi:hypothetical protein H112_02985 [Trichophyton rubrum D6]|nr:hypothetical protein H100_02989 [Trichophyton rubrum MR850]EZF43541.1 hypothetical protein H102_02983 [Trichophyton rubrum CBS 100081]EZF54193.1 hypothetical protein H103_02997 [Trichophyton rubrum CBS 288.86]EZF86033.1 hypothetical protein H110_02991 [Trichophyton rubrum MR1448]EZG18414.1 hypothetical protein H107_03083 [Trichophyton rubrum CBS 202.88]KDB35398.1 hypothetical protein H112_02985 [Trichophyton rubrum D6]